MPGISAPTILGIINCATWAVIGLLFCTVVGVIYGMLPAIKASWLHPIDALRYE